MKEAIGSHVWRPYSNRVQAHLPFTGDEPVFKAWTVPYHSTSITISINQYHIIIHDNGDLKVQTTCPYLLHSQVQTGNQVRDFLIAIKCPTHCATEAK